MQYAVMVVSGGSRAHLWMVVTQLQRLCSNTVSATGKDVVNILQKSSHNQTQEDVHLATVEHTLRRALQATSYHVIKKWECED